MEGAFLIILLVFGFAITVRLFAGGLDKDRMREYVESRGGEVLESNWSPFGTGWFGDKNNRIYEVRYQDADGNIHRATCKTSMLSGVYFTEDRIVDRPERSQSGSENETRPEIESLKEENRQLKEELARLKGERK